MEQELHRTDDYDYRQYDRVWQRVAPDLEPYPGLRAAPAMAERPETPAPPTAPEGSAPPENQLPGAQMNPCCMGTEAAEMLEVLAGFIEEELSDRRYFMALSRQAPSWARQRLREIGEADGAHARRLLAVYYLISGTCYRPAISCERIYIGRWCPALRERYHAEACNGFNYARAADSTTDPCLSKLLNELSAEEYRHADQLMTMLERTLRG